MSYSLLNAGYAVTLIDRRDIGLGSSSANTSMLQHEIDVPMYQPAEKIGYSTEYKNALFVLGFGGNGITFSIQGMEIIPDLLKGRDNKLTELYRFGR